MRRVLFLILFVMNSITFAQTADIPPCDPKPEAINFYEIGTTNASELKSRLEEYLKELASESSSQGYIINYGSDIEIGRREKIIRESIAFRNDDASRITFVRGGNGKSPKTELWILPSGADYPMPNYTENLRNNVRVIKTLKATSVGCETVKSVVELGKFDVFGKVSDWYFNRTLEKYIRSLEVDKTFKGYILNYGSDEEINDLENRVRNSELLKNGKDKQLTFIKGGIRKQPITELWIVAGGSEPPKP